LRDDEKENLPKAARDEERMLIKTEQSISSMIYRKSKMNLHWHSLLLIVEIDGVAEMA
jgi:hypothetical protein